MLALDRDQSWRAEQQMVDLAPLVAVAPDQHPVIAEHPAELPRRLLLASHPSGQFLLVI